MILSYRRLAAMYATVLVLSACSGPATDPQKTPTATQMAHAAPPPATPSSTPIPPATPSTEAAAPTSVPTTASVADPNKAVNDAIDSNLGDHTKYEPVIHAFQTAVANHDAQAIAAMVHYPFGVDIAGKNHVLKSPAEFVAAYDKFMTPEIRQVIVAQKYPDLFVNYKGVMFGQGQAWINGICTKDSKNCEKFDVQVVTIQSAP